MIEVIIVAPNFKKYQQNVFIQHFCFLLVTSMKSNHSCSLENEDEQHVGHSDSRTALQGDSESRGNEIHAWKTYMEMKGVPVRP